MKDINQVLLNPVRGRILQYISMHGTRTAGELSALITDVPRTTLYRHLKILLDNKVIKVVAENRVRGSVERTYALDLEAYSELNTKENATRNAFGFLMKLYADFAEYFADANTDPASDNIFLSNVSLLLSDEEFGDLLREINASLIKHVENKPCLKRRIRSISLISSPTTTERRVSHD